MGRIYFVIILFFAAVICTFPAYASDTEDLTLEQAITLALDKHPELAAALWEIRAREGRLRQAGTLPNPELEFSIDNFWGNKDLHGFNGAEYTVALTQLIELGGKRSKRAYAAVIERDLANWDHAARKLDIVNETTKAFVDVIAGQERLKVMEDLYSLAGQFFSSVAVRVQSGKVSPIEETRASAELSKTRIELERAKRSLEAAQKKLSAAIGNPAASFKKATGQLDLAAEIPASEQLLKDISRNPDVARWEAEIGQRRAVLNIERANRIPDPSVSIGVRRFRETETSALIAGISIPLPLFNQNSGAVSEAKSRLSKAEEEQKSAVLRAEAAVTEAYLALSSAFVEATALKKTILPELQAAFDAVQEGYRYGKFGFPDLLEAKRSLSESRRQFIESLAAYRKAYADVQRLTTAGPETDGHALRK